MAEYKGNRAKASRPSVSMIDSAALCVTQGEYEVTATKLSSTKLAVGDLIKLVKLPADSKIVDAAMWADDIEGSSAASIQLSAGIFNAAGTAIETTLFSATTMGRTAGILEMTHTIALYQTAAPSTDRDVGIYVEVAPGAHKSGTVGMLIKYRAKNSDDD